VKDINGQELHKGGAGLLFCEIIEISEEGVLVRIMNSDLQLLVGSKHDEVLGGTVADSELTAFVEAAEPDGLETPPAPETSLETKI